MCHCHKPQRLLPCLAVLFSLGAGLSGCATIVATEAARPVPPSPERPHPTRLNAAYYALLPVTIPFDLVTLPIQIVVFEKAFPSG